MLSEEKILGREGCSRLGQSDCEPEDIVDRAKENGNDKRETILRMKAAFCAVSVAERVAAS